MVSKKKILAGVSWRLAERIVAQGVSFIVSLVLARLLMPEEYGIVSLVLVFINIANVFVSDGLGAALIQKKDPSKEDYSTMFLCGLFMAMILYAAVYFCAPLISKFYGNESINNVIRVLALQLPISAVKAIQNAYVSKNMLFRKFFFSTIGGTVVSGIIGILMAINGFGVWSLVAQYLVNSIVDMLVLFLTVSWKPGFAFCWGSARQLFSYSWSLLLASLINTLYNECRNLIIGRVYSSADLAYNSKGGQFPSLFINNINVAISNVLFPALSNVNDEKEKVKELTRNSMQLSSYLIFPLMFGMSAIAEPMIKVLLTDKWLPVVPFLRIFCFYWMFQPCLTANVQALKACGRSDICLKLEIIKKTIGFILVFMTMHISVLALALSNALFAIISTVINIIPNRKIISYGLMEQVKDLGPSFVASLLMAIVVYFIGTLIESDIIALIVQIVVGGLVYIILSFLFRIKGFYQIVSVLKSR